MLAHHPSGSRSLLSCLSPPWRFGCRIDTPWRARFGLRVVPFQNGTMGDCGRVFWDQGGEALIVQWHSYTVQ